MDISNPHNQGYWFVVREDQSNVIFSSNNFTIQNPQIAAQETRYIIDTSDNRQYIHVNEAPVVIQEETVENCEKTIKQSKEEDCFWDRNKIKLLLTYCLENKFINTNVTKEKTLWDKIAASLQASPDECIKKYRNLRRTYIRLLKKKRLGKDIKWVHFNICEEVFKDCKSLSLLEPWEDNKVKRLLSLYIENLYRFRNPDCLQKDIWKEISSMLGTTEYNCYHKFKNLKRTYFNWLERSRETGKLIKWPYHHYFERIFSNYKPSIGPWDRNRIKQLLDAYAQIAHKFRNPKFQKKELWKEISMTVGQSPSNCDRKFRNLKQTYIKLKMRADSGGTITKWRYYKDFETIYNNTLHYISTDDGPRVLESQDYITHLLTFYIENKEKFRDPLIKKKNLWKIIGPKIGLSSEECDKKFRNLKQTYIRLTEKKKETGSCNKWPYYTYFEKIYDDTNLSTKEYSDSDEIDNTTLSEVRRLLNDVQERRDSDKFEKLIQVAEESNNIQRERNRILQALLDRK